MQSSAKSPIFKLLAAFGIVLGMLLSPVSAAPLTNEQKDALRDYFDANDKIASFGSKPLELLDKPGLNDFFEQYGNALLLVRIGNDLQGANDWDALKKVFEKLGDVGIKKLASLDPSIASFASAFGWFGWAKTGMELVKKFAYDPGVTSLALQMYSARRQEGAEPSDAVVNIPFGPMRALAQEEFFKNYNKDLLLEPGSKDKMRPEWEAKLDQFLNSWMEDLYQQSLAEKAKQALVAKATEAKTQVPGLEKQLLDLLGGSTGLVPDESVALLLDASGSMDEQGRMVAAKASARQVIGQMTGKVEVALIVFYECGDVRVAAEFTTDPAPLLAALEPVAPSGGTPLAEGISFAKEYLRTKGKGASRRLVVLTDGAESCSGDLLGAARK
jgi:hypothetical protein